MQRLHPLRLQYELFSNANPSMGAVAPMAELVRTNRRPVAADNPAREPAGDGADDQENHDVADGIVAQD